MNHDSCGLISSVLSLVAPQVNGSLSLIMNFILIVTFSFVSTGILSRIVSTNESTCC